MAGKRASGMLIALASIVAPSCATSTSNDPPVLTFVIDEIGNDQWSHHDDGSFDVHHAVTVRVTAPGHLRGRFVTVQINALAPVATGATVGTEWSATLENRTLDDDQLQAIVYRRITETHAGS